MKTLESLLAEKDACIRQRELLRDLIRCRYYNSLVGCRIGRLTIEKYPVSVDGKFRALCKCECGQIRLVLLRFLLSDTMSCGCWRTDRVRFSVRPVKHGKHHSSIYNIWHGIMQRCYNKRSKSYPDYGGRGITVSPQWQNFESFYADMGDKPPGMSVERKDNALGYSKENCKWATPMEQARNSRQNVIVQVDGSKMVLTDAARLVGMSTSGVRYRLKHAIPLPDALEREQQSK